MIYFPMVNSIFSEMSTLTPFLSKSRAHMEARLSRMESIVEMAADKIPTITIRTNARGIMVNPSSDGVARSGADTPGTSSLALNPHQTETIV